MDRDQIKRDYERYSPEFKKFQTEIFEFVDEIAFSGRYSNIDVAEVKQRPRADIKKLNSIEKNLTRPKKYPGHKDLFDINDIAGIRVICHCEDDMNAFAEILENRLNESKYLGVRRVLKTGHESESTNEKSNPLYRAIHIDCAKKVTLDEEERLIYCEIQVRTVMGDAWSVQDSKYVYKKNPEEERSALSNSVNGIMTACEALWALVKKKYRDGEDIDETSFRAIERVVETETARLQQADGDKFVADLNKDNL